MKKLSCCFTVCVFGILFLSTSFADQVTPTDRVVTSVIVREEATSDSAVVGSLWPGENAQFLESVPRWYKVRLSNSQEGFVSKSWTRIVATTPGATTSFEIHFLDVGTGDSAIIDMGDREIVIDGGNSISVLHNYAQSEDLIQGPVELVVVTHGDSDHWKGLVRLLNFDGRAMAPHTLLEFWEPGYNRDCRQLDSYDTFINNVRNVNGIVFRRPLETTHQPSVASGQVTSFSLPSLPGVTFTVLYSAASPPASNGDCSYRINNASIVLMVEISGVRILFTGDANGKERNEGSPGTPGHIERMLLDLEVQHPGTLRANVVKVPHHGSETASTQEFINAVNPEFVIISASTRHHLPRSTVVDRYSNGQRVILRTDSDHQQNIDHIICAGSAMGQVDCNYKSVLEEN